MYPHLRPPCIRNIPWLGISFRDIQLALERADQSSGGQGRWRARSCRILARMGVWGCREDRHILADTGLLELRDQALRYAARGMVDPKWRTRIPLIQVTAARRVKHSGARRAEVATSLSDIDHAPTDCHDDRDDTDLALGPLCARINVPLVVLVPHPGEDPGGDGIMGDLARIMRPATQKLTHRNFDLL